MYLDRCLASPIHMVQVLSRWGGSWLRRAAAERQLSAGRLPRRKVEHIPSEEGRVMLAKYEAQLAEQLGEAQSLAAVLKVSGGEERVGRHIGGSASSLACRAGNAALQVGRLVGLAVASLQLLKAQAPACGQPIVFIQEKVARDLLGQVQPSSRYGGRKRSHASRKRQVAAGSPVSCQFQELNVKS
ncbi:hypothetical protein AK812_SmicGene25234 [Symbiodinium microadriaticum]|uniref:Uncharacterized protein n=1 Tax=Symbiodinium microadriaticum TaxID=2951 RepID=A0A1Q9DCG8_SYMMI|nr:hypothetical protein AK812_SmicGene25234 [Symbiodinium microadriaticum]